MGIGEEMRVAVVIEDEVDIRHLLEAVLQQAGFQVIATGNGPDGIEAVRHHQPAVVTLDVNMPGMDGFEVARRIRAFSDTYIVMLTALQDEIDTLDGLRAGADDYLTKPFRPRELRARIEAMLRRPRSAANAPPAPASIPATIEIAPSAIAEAVRAQPPVTEHPVTEHPVTEQRVPEHRAAERAKASHERPVVTSTFAADVRPPDIDNYVVPSGEGWLAHNGLSLNTQSGEVFVDGRDVVLLRSEFDLLASLLKSGRRVRTKPDLVLLLRRESFVTTHFVSDAEKRAIDVLLVSLRKKLGENSTEPRWIESVGAVGYRSTADDSL
ncbi:response regulator transcription factor [Lacisediminihabitans changchengi]|uniref:Response regulator n=1 Tax=Lacisediminihabitans changchengi TaxID=2787634 RepID=A0A934SMD7_9MICO|nr:response regulator transcription factor [Lacisediminihabitans changchengi]MBK4346868.1 response regulator [Lacisediminihabitans changchengi]MBK4348009.1 response regulator [Lacisediminihabitans changchengi]